MASIVRVLDALTIRAIITRMWTWLRWPSPSGDEPRIVLKGDRPEQQPDVDRIAELVRIVGEPDAPRPRAKPTSARRSRSRHRG